MRKSIYREDYEQIARHVNDTGGDLRIIPMLGFITRCAAEKILMELDRAGLTARYKSNSGHGSMRVISKCAAPSMIVHYLNERAQSAPHRVVVSSEKENQFDPDSSVLVVGGPCAVFERGRWFMRSDFAATLLEACWETGMVVKLRTKDKKERCFIVCGDVAPLDCDMPDPQWLEEVRLVDGEWWRVVGGLRIEAKDGKRVTLREVRS